MIHSNIDLFSQHSQQQLQSRIIEQEQSIVDTRSSIENFFEYLQQLNQINLEHSTEINMANIDFDKHQQPIIDTLETTENHVDLCNEIADIRRLEKYKRQLEKELLEQTILLENISTVIGKSID